MDKKEMAKEVLDKMYEQTKVPAYKFKLTEDKATIFDSKAGGLGYAPHGVDFPKNSEGNELRLLAQINCADVDLEDFPKSGLLQFWVLDEDLAGMDFDDGTNQDGFRVIYYVDVDKSVTEEELKAKSNPYFDEEGEEYLPVMGEYKIVFEKADDSLSPLNSSYFIDGEKMFVDIYNEMFPNDKIEEISDLGFELDEIDKDVCDGNFGHKIGGYPGFTQWDPRKEDDSHDFLLFQLDSDYGDGKDKVMWGDSGIGNFFINREKLKALDFSDVLYNWDCY